MSRVALPSRVPENGPAHHLADCGGQGLRLFAAAQAETRAYRATTDEPDEHLPWLGP